VRESEREREGEREEGSRGERDVMKLLPTGMSRRALDERYRDRETQTQTQTQTQKGDLRL
jgi:hypothetical protein